MDEVDYIFFSGDSYHGYFLNISTKKPTSPRLGTIRQVVVGYDSAREFYHPKYGALDVSFTEPDNRTTLFWTSDLKTDQDGLETLKFYNTDTTHKLLVTIEGVANGIPISATQIIGKAD